MLVGGDAAVQPADGAMHGFGHAREVGRGRGYYVVQLHDDVGADGVLQSYGVFRGEEPWKCRLEWMEWRWFLAYIGELSCGLEKRTPSSVTFASFRRDTI